MSEQEKPRRYLWSTHGELRRAVDNLAAIAHEVEAVSVELRELKDLYDLPDEAQVDDLLDKVETIQSQVGEVHKLGDEKASALKSALLEGEI